MKAYRVGSVLLLIGGCMWMVEAAAQAFTGSTRYYEYLKEHIADFQKGNNVISPIISWGNEIDSGIIYYDLLGSGMGMRDYRYSNTTATWHNDFYTRYVYDLNGDITYQKTIYYDTAWSDWSDLTIVYNNRLKTEELPRYWSATYGWQAYNRFYFMYDAANNMTEKGWEMNGFMLLRDSMVYSSGHLTEVFHWEYNHTDYNLTRAVYSYDSRDDSTLVLVYRWNANAWNTWRRILQTYNSAHQLLDRKEDVWYPNNTYYPDNEYIYVYDSQNRIVQYTYSGGEWWPPYTSFVYDSNNRLILEYTKTRNPVTTQWDTTSFYRYHYSDMLSVSTPDLEADEPRFAVFPNPANYYISILVDDVLTSAEVIISDVTGRKMLAAELQTPNTKLQTENLSNGVYLVTVSSDNGSVATKKLVINR